MLKLCNSIKTNAWYLQSLEKLAIKMWFLFTFSKKLKDRHFVVGGSKTFKFSTNTCFGVSFQKNVFSSLLLFLSVCLEKKKKRFCKNHTYFFLKNIYFFSLVLLHLSNYSWRLPLIYLLKIKMAASDKLLVMTRKIC